MMFICSLIRGASRILRGSSRCFDSISAIIWSSLYKAISNKILFLRIDEI